MCANERSILVSLVVSIDLYSLVLPLVWRNCADFCWFYLRWFNAVISQWYSVHSDGLGMTEWMMESFETEVHWWFFSSFFFSRSHSMPSVFADFTNSWTFFFFSHQSRIFKYAITNVIWILLNRPLISNEYMDLRERNEIVSFRLYKWNVNKKKHQNRT